LFEHALEAEDIELVGVDIQLVTRRVRQQHSVSGRKQGLAEAGDLGLEAVAGALVRAPAPERLDQDVARDDLVGMHEQQGEKRSLLRPPEREQTGVRLDFEGPKNPELHSVAPLRQHSDATTPDCA
jgi:hypothetical protein